MPTIGVVVVTHRSEAVLPACLATLRHHEPGVALVVVDDASPDGPPRVDDGIDVLTSAENRGYGTASNRGAEHLLRAYPSIDVLAFLNPDVRLRGPALGAMADRLRDDDRLGIVTGRVVDGEGRQQAAAWGPTSLTRAVWAGTGWRLPRLRRAVGRVLRRGAGTSSTSTRHAIQDVDGHVLGGAMAVSTACWTASSGFDEAYHLYWEDADLCARARALGFKLAVVDTPPIVHLAGTSSAGVTDGQRWRWYRAGAAIFASKHLDARPARWHGRALRLGALVGRRGHGRATA